MALQVLGGRAYAEDVRRRGYAAFTDDANGAPTAAVIQDVDIVACGQRCRSGGGVCGRRTRREREEAVKPGLIYTRERAVARDFMKQGQGRGLCVWAWQLPG
jgi:hypothetical protein